MYINNYYVDVSCSGSNDNRPRLVGALKFPKKKLKIIVPRSLLMAFRSLHTTLYTSYYYYNILYNIIMTHCRNTKTFSPIIISMF